MEYLEQREWIIPSIPEETGRIREEMQDMLEEISGINISEGAVFSANLALEEALVNHEKHGNKLDPEKMIHVICTVTKEGLLTIMSWDEGEGFEPDKLPDPTAKENLEKPCGRGVMLMKAFMDSVTYPEERNGSPVNGGSYVVMTRDLTEDRVAGKKIENATAE